jgi:SAM-dependent methyltransferase
LAAKEYLSRRLEPSRSILFFGCGGSPYWTLFRKTESALELSGRATWGSTVIANSQPIADRSKELQWEALATKEYLRQRLEPRPGDLFYLCLSDLLAAIKRLIPPQTSRVLDYGCGGSPYRVLFGECTYHRADLAGWRNLDFEYSADGRLPAEAADYDCVLSTQVLEHVEDPTAYLRECYRVLRPGGNLLLTTHGIFEDHAVPHDYWRWTAGGLQRMIEEAGLRVTAAKKLTTGPRGVVSLSERELHRLRFNSAGVYGSLLSFGVRAIQRLGARRLHEASDRGFPDHRVVDAGESDHDIYIGIAMLANRET